MGLHGLGAPSQDITVTGPAPHISVIIPTHNRRESLARTLEALAAQTLLAERFEVIVVADGCKDDTESWAGSVPLPYRLTLIPQHPAQGQGKARNVGAARATGPLLVFLDDDIEPQPGMLEAYQRAHRRHPRHLLLGAAVPVLSEETSLFSQGLRNWWTDHAQALSRTSHRFTYRDMHSGNFSIAADLFAEAKGFDAEFFGRSGEDYELGMRLLSMGVPFAFEPEAAGLHHDATVLARALIRVRLEGRADVLIGIRHPELRGGLALAAYRKPRSRLLRTLRDLAFHSARTGSLAAQLLQFSLGPLERLRLRRTWRAAHGALRAYWYCRGAAEELRQSASSQTLDRFFETVPAERPLADIRLDDGVVAAERELDELRPEGARLWLGGRSVAEIPALPGSEPLRGRHLAAVLGGKSLYNLLVALSVNALHSGIGWLEVFDGRPVADEPPQLEPRSP